MTPYQEMMARERWRQRVERAGFRADERDGVPARRPLVHAPGSCANLVPVRDTKGE